VDFDNEASRNAFYDGILADPRMQEVPDPNRTEEQGGNLTPSCISDGGKAFPPRRLVEVAKRFGANGIIQSICEADFGPAMDAIIEVIAKQLGAVCLPRKLVRDADGLVGCNVVWELPPPNLAPTNTPTTCGQGNWAFLLPPDEGRESVTDQGGQVCTVQQLAVVGNEAQGTNGFSDGWFYDDFSEEVEKECTGESKQRIAFTPSAKPPTGVTVKLECLNETQSLADNRTDIQTGIEQPSVGDPCDNITRNGHGMFCHPGLNVCVLKCSTDADCPAAWVCDGRGETVASTDGPDPGISGGSPMCVNPTCGEGA